MVGQKLYLKMSLSIVSDSFADELVVVCAGVDGLPRAQRHVLAHQQSEFSRLANLLRRDDDTGIH